MHMSVALLWLRNDLRLHDHEALHQAVRRAPAIVPVYCFDERLFEETPYGFQRCGALRLRFLIESVQQLQKSFAEKGVKMHVCVGKPELQLAQLAQQTGAKWLYYHREAATEELADEQAVEAALLKLGLECHSCWGSTLFHPDDLPFPISRLPEVFTEFRKKTERESEVRESRAMPRQMKGLPDLPADIWPPMPAQIADERIVYPFKGGEAAGLARLHAYFWEGDHLQHYKETRNGLLGADYSSKFSPWLALGCLSPRFIYEEVKRYEKQRVANDSTYWLIFELLWRDYFRFVAFKHGKKLFLKGGIRQYTEGHAHKPKALQLWREGKTGQPFIDANMRELAATGFMSNRGRQNVASYLVHHLKSDWRAGAAWFEHCLLDYDPCSNYGNWNYLAGVGNDPRENRVFNPQKQAEQYDPSGSYRRFWL